MCFQSDMHLNFCFAFWFVLIMRSEEKKIKLNQKYKTVD